MPEGDPFIMKMQDGIWLQRTLQKAGFKVELTPGATPFTFYCKVYNPNDNPSGPSQPLDS